MPWSSVIRHGVRRTLDQAGVPHRTSTAPVDDALVGGREERIDCSTE